jgi:two-component system nitrogen regulation response regulator NtrX
MKQRILVVDDEQGIRQSLAGVLADEGYAVEAVESGEACLDLIARKPFDLVLLDIWLPQIDGLDTLERLRKLEQPPAVIMISGHGNIETAVRATKLGAFDFIEKPLSIEKTLLSVKHALEQQALAEENIRLRRGVESRCQIIGESVPIKALRQQLALMAPTNGRVLIYGESGTGKELAAQAIHAQSQRARQAFVEVNCAAIPEELIESELFGHLKGSFTGAVEHKMGKFQRADGGTLFLDEVGDMSLKTQAKVLRALEEQRFQAVGGADAIHVDVRVVASTNKDLEEEIARGNFREDLFYRLNVVPAYLPPLRERLEDVPLLAAHFLAEFCSAYGRKRKHFTADAISALQHYTWPGNVRELRNLVERVVILHPQQEQMDRRQLPPLIFRQPRAANGRAARASEFSTLQQARAAYERELILKKLEESQGNVSRAAEALGLERSHLYRKMKSLGITKE